MGTHIVELQDFGCKHYNNGRCTNPVLDGGCCNNMSTQDCYIKTAFLISKNIGFVECQSCSACKFTPHASSLCGVTGNCLSLRKLRSKLLENQGLSSFVASNAAKFTCSGLSSVVGLVVFVLASIILAKLNCWIFDWTYWIELLMFVVVYAWIAYALIPLLGCLDIDTYRKVEEEYIAAKMQKEKEHKRYQHVDSYAHVRRPPVPYPHKYSSPERSYTDNSMHLKLMQDVYDSVVNYNRSNSDDFDVETF